MEVVIFSLYTTYFSYLFSNFACFFKISNFKNKVLGFLKFLETNFQCNYSSIYLVSYKCASNDVIANMYSK